MRIYDINRAQYQLMKVRAYMGPDQELLPVDEIKKPKYMRTVIFNNRIRRIKRLELKIRSLIREGAEKALYRAYRA